MSTPSPPGQPDHRIRVRTRASAASELRTPTAAGSGSGPATAGPSPSPAAVLERPEPDETSAPSRRRLLVGPRVRLAVLVGATGLAYQHSLEDLTRTLSYDTPLAYLGIVPVLALVLGAVRGRDALDDRLRPHRQVDWLIGVPLLATASWVALEFPQRLGYSFWTSRIDVLGLPFFVAGLTAVLFGARVLRRVVPAVVLLAFAWPFPYERIIDDVLVAAQQLTLAAVRVVAGSVGARNTTDALFEIGSGAEAFVVNVAPQCAGASGVVGWLLLGSSVCLALPAGRRLRKLAWLATGVVGLLLANVGRIASLFALGSAFGERVAIDWVHPYVGLVVFVTAVVVLVALLPRFGLAPASSLLPPRRPPTDDPGSSPRLVRIGAPALLTVVLLTSVLHPVNTSLDRFDPFRDVEATNASLPFAAAASNLDGYQGAPYDAIEWGQQYFGTGSTWIRHRYQSARVATPIYVDVISTDDLRSFTEFGVEACYRFHDYGIVDQGTVDVGAAVPAQHLTFFNLDTGTWWSAMAVVQATDDAGRRRYERVLSLVPLGGYDADVAPDEATIEAARNDLAEFARATVRATATTA